MTTEIIDNVKKTLIMDHGMRAHYHSHGGGGGGGEGTGGRGGGGRALLFYSITYKDYVPAQYTIDQLIKKVYTEDA